MINISANFYFLIFCILFWGVVFRRIYANNSRTTTWGRKLKTGAITVLVFSIVLLPFVSWGVFRQMCVENREHTEWGSDTFVLDPGEAYTSDTLSFRFVVLDGVLRLSTDGENVTFYISDENTPEIQYYAGNYTNSSERLFRLPYAYLGFYSEAKWTMHFYNPSQNATVEVSFEFFTKDTVLPPVELRMRLDLNNYLIAIFSMWIVAGITTRNARNKERNLSV